MKTWSTPSVSESTVGLEVTAYAGTDLTTL